MVELLEKALEYERSNRMAQAYRMYLRVLERQPGNAGARREVAGGAGAGGRPGMSTPFALPRPAVAYTRTAWRAARQAAPGRAVPAVPYGLRQEEQLKRGLAREFEVIASADLDYLQKLDCVVRDRLHPELPAVGVQVTLKTHDKERMLATLR